MQKAKSENTNNIDQDFDTKTPKKLKRVVDERKKSEKVTLKKMAPATTSWLSFLLNIFLLFAYKISWNLWIFQVNKELCGYHCEILREFVEYKTQLLLQIRNIVGVLSAIVSYFILYYSVLPFLSWNRVFIHTRLCVCVFLDFWFNTRE